MGPCRTSVEYNGNFAGEIIFDDGDTYVVSLVSVFAMKVILFCSPLKS